MNPHEDVRKKDEADLKCLRIEAKLSHDFAKLID